MLLLLFVTELCAAPPGRSRVSSSVCTVVVIVLLVINVRVLVLVVIGVVLVTKGTLVVAVEVAPAEINEHSTHRGYRWHHVRLAEVASQCCSTRCAGDAVHRGSPLHQEIIIMVWSF